MQKKKVLVIDDEQIVLDSVCRILKEENCEVQISLRGEQGLDRALSEEYDIVLTDIRMPTIGGMRILRDVKRAKPSLPVIIMTGYATVKSAVQAMKLGAADYIEKPFTPEELLNTVSSALEDDAAHPPEDQELIHKNEILKVLDRAASDPEFFRKLLTHRTNVLADFELTGPEKLALLTGDISWIEENIGQLTDSQRRWFDWKATYAQLSMDGFF